jgi:AcrR family transcriptional regulator
VGASVAKRKGRPPAATAGAGPPTRELILDTAERLFAARGVDGVAVRDLAAEMGITASSLYNHFPGKQALYDAVIERGLGPIVDLVSLAWRDGFQPDDVRKNLEALTAHLARHPHLAPLLQRAILEESAGVQALLERWMGSLYREGVAVLDKAARDAGWDADEVPHLAIALFGMIFAYFTNGGGLRRTVWGSDTGRPEQALAVQRKFLERAVLRLIGPQRRTLDTGRRRATHG